MINGRARITLVSMSGLRVGHQRLLEVGLTLPGLSRRAGALSQLPPLGLLTLAGLFDDRWDVQLIQDDGTAPIEQTVEAILSNAPDLVAFSSLTPAIDRAAAISDQLRHHKLITIIGGLHATAAPQTCSDHFDVVARGDGEPIMLQIIQDYWNQSLKRRYEADGSFDINNSPLPRWGLLGASRPPRYTLQTQRGCPWACSFCAASRLLGPVRMKSAKRVREELDQICQHQSRPWLELADDNTFANDRVTTDILLAFKHSGARWFTESDWRISQRPDLLKQIADSGCRQILVGVESSVFRYRGMGRKSASLDEITEACVAIQAAGIVVNSCFIVGADGETSDSISRLGDFLEQAPFGEIQLTLQTPFPGSSLYDSLKAAGRLLDSDFKRYTLFDVVFRPDQMSANDLQTQFDALVERSFSDSSQTRRDAICKSIRATRKTMSQLPS